MKLGKEVDAGTYNTNEYATITYTNYLGNECQKEFPIPSLTWMGAKVTYVFYLVNESGQPVNRAGKVVPFAEAVYVTDPVTYDVTWNEEAGIEKLEAEYLASQIVPDVYALYDQNAYYEVLVYQNEKSGTYNHFIIEGSASGTENSEAGLTVTNLETTKVFNTKAGTRYDDYGAYSATAGSYTSSKSKNTYTATVTNDIDYANTTVAFAVVWKPQLVEDTIVIDYGLDVVPNVYTNDGLAAGVKGVMLTAPNNVEINKGTYGTAVGLTSITSKDGLWTANVENQQQVRFHMNEMGINAPVTFYYEAGVNYYTYDTNDNATLNTTNMYSSVTVIPATTIYYEDEFVTFTTQDSTGNTVENRWTSIGTTKSATQDVDRPGVTNSMSSDYDANNLYGYDGAYVDSSLYSLGSAQMITVDSNIRGIATFSFYGTGFDIIGLTSNTTGTLIVQVYDAEGNAVKTSVVDTYYGYAYGDNNNDGVDEWYTVDSDSSNALYQVPVMKIIDLYYGKYTVKLTAGYNSSFDHTADEVDESGNTIEAYTLYIDAVRIYDPANDGYSDGTVDTTIKDAYKADEESYPIYKELRNLIIGANSFGSYLTVDTNNASAETTVSGVAFIDSNGSVSTISDYNNYGPNNELYLAPGQSIAFAIEDVFINSDETQITPVDIQLGIKSVENSADIEIFNPEVKTSVSTEGTTVNTTKTFVKNNLIYKTISTATDMYYSIKDASKGTIVISNSGTSGIISITNLKFTFEEAATIKKVTTTNEDGTEQEGEAAVASISEEGAVFALRSLSAYSISESVEVEPEIFIPETFEVSLDKTEVKVNKKVKVTVTTSEEVEYITVNGEVIEDCRTNKKTGLKTWSVRLTPTEAGEFPIEVIAYNEEGTASESVTETVTVTRKNNKGMGGR